MFHVVGSHLGNPAAHARVTASQPASIASGRIGVNDETGVFYIDDVGGWSPFGPYGSVLEGAAADGVTDDSAVFAAAFLANRGKTLYIPSGTYRLNSGLTISGSHTRVVGLGQVFLRFAVTGAGITINNSAGTTQGGTLENVYIQSIGSSGTTGLALSNISYWSIKDVWVHSGGSSGKWTKGIDLVACEDMTFLGGWVWGVGAGGIVNGFVSDTNSRGNTVCGLSITGSSTLTANGVLLNGGSGLQWFGGVVQGGFVTSAINITGGGGTSPQFGAYGIHVEVTNGAPGYLYDNSADNAHVALYNPRGGDVSIGPTNTTYNFAVYGGRLDAVTLGTGARHPVIMPAAVDSITDNGATLPVFGQFHVFGATPPSFARHPAIEFYEVTAPAAPSTNRCLVYAQDNGAGKTQLMALFPTGAAQQISIEP